MEKELIKKVISDYISGTKTFCDMSIEERGIFLDLVKNGVLYDERKNAKIGLQEDRSMLQIHAKDERWYLDKDRLFSIYGVEDILEFP